jgi:hypothetical protein
MRVLAVLFVTLGLASQASAPALAAGPCEEFTWNVSRERSLFAETPVQLAAGRDAASAPPITPERLYQLTLAPQTDVHLAVPAGHKPRGGDTWSGLLRLPISQAGVYRVSLSEGDWIDVIRDGKEIASEDHQGRPGCSAPHKLVQFRLPSGEILIQLSGASSPTVKLTVTPAPPNPDNAK